MGQSLSLLYVCHRKVVTIPSGGNVGLGSQVRFDQILSQVGGHVQLSFWVCVLWEGQALHEILHRKRRRKWNGLIHMRFTAKQDVIGNVTAGDWVGGHQD